MARRVRIIEQSLSGLRTTNSHVAPCAVERHALSEMVELCRAVCFPQYMTSTVEPRILLNRIGVILGEQLVNGFNLRDTYARHDTVSSRGPVATTAPADTSSVPPRGDPEPPLPASLRAGTVFSSNKAELFRQCADIIVDEFLLCRLPKIKVLLKLDVDALYDNDVAAESKCEIVMCYPGITCMLHQRIAHHLFLLGAPNNVTRMLTEIAHSLTGIDIHPHTSIGHHFFVDHGTGVVIGATSIIGNYVCIYQGVTLGAKSFPIDSATGQRIKFLPRHPIIEDRVTVYSNAVVLGRITIGRGSTIAGNAWVTNSVPPNSTVAHTSPGKVLKGTNANVALFLQSDGAGI
mmetsp:Transcript_51731/g.59427  ORF Transcript_51731/g.59427 Transcript_51731/m.59427 type:complete len:347 (-) Transcript_51731:125-1165(-)